MPDWTLPMDGGCRCGKVRLRISKPPMMTMLCHCIGCQHMSASAFSTTIIVPTDGFAVTQGETVTGGLHGDQARHNHCDWCKSWMFTRIEPDMGFVNVRAGALDDPSWFVPFAEVYTSEALPWAIAGAPHSYEKFPPMEDYPKLIDAFAAG
ncbi:MAG: GFA family protein [Proteobacteria bacterium]|nr:GFA family protein [Pseudomonadota bacterium]